MIVLISFLGGRCVTGSYDRTARIWDVETGDELQVLRGHQNAVFSVEYNYPKWFVHFPFRNIIRFAR